MKKMKCIIPVLLSMFMLASCGGEDLPSIPATSSEEPASILESQEESSSIELPSEEEDSEPEIPSDYYEMIDYSIEVIIPENWSIKTMYDEDAVVYAWVWGGTYLEGTWVETRQDEKKVLVTLDIGASGFNLARFPKDIESPDWGKQWNQTEDVTIEEGVTDYSINIR